MKQFIINLFSNKGNGNGKEAGFTLIEIIAVLIILAILSTIVVAKTVDLRTSAIESKVGEVVQTLNANEKLLFAEAALAGSYTTDATFFTAKISPAISKLMAVDPDLVVSGISAAGFTLEFQGQTFTLNRTQAADNQIACWNYEVYTP